MVKASIFGACRSSIEMLSGNPVKKASQLSLHLGSLEFGKSNQLPDLIREDVHAFVGLLDNGQFSLCSERIIGEGKFSRTSICSASL